VNIIAIAACLMVFSAKFPWHVWQCACRRCACCLLFNAVDICNCLTCQLDTHNWCTQMTCLPSTN